uniref:Uncharacterized protein n=1 Tax=Globisporangium ultimum (strain ATCC 200006 / CBS 805.95 / DAOM BR144) TaxID=431595 RepID=K3X594_GLOUD
MLNVTRMSRSVLRAAASHSSRAPFTAAPARASTLQRRFVQTNVNQQPAAAATQKADNTNAAAAAGAAGAEEEAPKYKPGWFSRNPGITLGGILLSIGLYIYRGTQNKKNFDALQAPIAEEAVISPYEAWELRSANDITPETYESVRAGVFKAFPTRKAAMEHFDQYLGFKLAESCPNGLRNAYHLERVLLSLERDENKKIDVDALMVAFSMAVKGAAEDRLQCLFDLATESSGEPHEGEPEREITQQQLERLLELLLKTYQIPSEKRVLTADEKYPFQQYKAATPHDLLEADQQAQVDAKKITAAEANSRSSYTFEAFSEIMRGKTVCVWGECFANSKKRMKN